MADELQTPRDPAVNEEWSDEISTLLSQWGEISLCYGWLHNYSQRKYKRKYHHMSMPIIVLSTLTGTANFADSYVPDGFKQGFSACVGGLNIFCGILGTLMSFLKYAEVYEAHRIAAVSWSSLGRNIQIELALKEERRKNCRDFLKVSRAEYDRLLESSPGIDQDIISMFNKRFADKYPLVTKPIICNGLQEVKVYSEGTTVAMPSVPTTDSEP
eukprot:COSAG05_NODE_1157_length_5683_cov_2.960064_3_plen_214_part_00